MENKVLGAPIEYVENMGGAQGPSIDGFAMLAAVLQRWKLITALTLSALVATYGVLRLVPARYESTVEILVFDPQQQIDTTVQKPISPFVEALGLEAMNTEIKVLKSKSVALRVVGELGLDLDPEFQSHDQIADLVKQFRDRIAALVKRIGFPGLGQAFDNSGETTGFREEQAEKLDRAADALLKRLEVSQESYIISVTAASRDPSKAQRLASAIANDYLVSLRETRQEALEHAATWVKGRVDDVQFRISKTEGSIQKLAAESGIRDTESIKIRERQIGDLNAQLMTAREEVADKLARLEQARHVIDTNGDIDTMPEESPIAIDREKSRNNGDLESIPELAFSYTLRDLRRKQIELSQRLTVLQNRLGEHNIQVVSARAELATLKKQLNAEAERVLSTMKNAYDVAARREQLLEANLRSFTASLNSESYMKLQELQRVVEIDHKVYENYIAQYNDIAKQREMQYSSARIISPATLPSEPSTKRLKFYAFGSMAGLAGGLLLAFALEYFRRGLRTSTQVEQSFGLPVVGNIPLVSHPKTLGASNYRQLARMVSEPPSQLSEAVRAMRINMELSNSNPKVILITSALPAEGKSTAAMLLAASSASSGRRSILLDCDLRLGSTSKALRNKGRPGLSELLRGTAKLTDLITEDPVTKAYMIPAGSKAPNAPDLLMSHAMLDLVAALRGAFDCIVMDAPPLLPVVDALALATVADKILVIVEWCQTSHASIYEAFRVLGPEVNRVAGIVLNKVDFDKLPRYRGRYYRSIVKYFRNA